MRLMLCAAIIFVSTSVNAALVDNGSYTSDTVSGLDWLDLTETQGMTMVDALAANSDWRFASNAEVEDLFDQMFIGYYDTSPNGYSATWSGTSYADQNADVLAFESLFGFYDAGGWTHSLGLYLDEDGIARQLGVQTSLSPTFATLVHGVEAAPDRSNLYSTTSGDPSYGAYLVRSSVVPIPAAVWLFGSALAGLGWLRRKHST